MIYIGQYKGKSICHEEAFVATACGMGDEYIDEFGLVAIRKYCPNCGAKMDKVGKL